MARWCGGKETESKFNAAQQWRQRCLIKGGSIFSDNSLWTLENLEGLNKYFVNGEDPDKGNFLEKLEIQIKPTKPAVKQLAAEMMWLMLLCLSNIGADKKRESVNRIWAWSEEKIKSAARKSFLSDDLLLGIGSAGTSFNTNRWRELVYFIQFGLSFFQLSSVDREEVLSSGWKLAEWLERIEENDSRQLRHMLLFLLYPDDFERIFSGGARRKVVGFFAGKTKAEASKLSALQLDRELIIIRKQQEEEHGTDKIDFYKPPLKEQWQDAKPTTTNQIKEPKPVMKSNTMEEPINTILYGPPGTGKTYELNRLVKNYVTPANKNQVQQTGALKSEPPSKQKQQRYEFVTFHQAYSYEDFVEGIRPVQDEDSGELVYRVMPGVFRRICEKAKNDPTKRYALFIDEINRGNIAKIFGELITLIETDKRAEYNAEGELSNTNQGMTLTLPYSGDGFSVPKNLDIYGTMNTANRSIALLDNALRRRFTFEELMPDSSIITGSSGDGHIEDGEGGVINLRAMLDAMNQRISFLLNRDLMLGHAYLCKVKDFSSLKEVLLNQFIPLLQEYFYDDWSRIQLVFRDIAANNTRIKPQIIEHQKLKEIEVLGFDHDDFDDVMEYTVASPDAITPESIRKIYAVQEQEQEPEPEPEQK